MKRNKMLTTEKHMVKIWTYMLMLLMRKFVKYTNSIITKTSTFTRMTYIFRFVWARLLFFAKISLRLYSKYDQMLLACITGKSNEKCVGH